MPAQQLEVTTAAAGGAAPVLPSVLSAAQLRIASALLRCVGRWGLSKTTIEDIAREAGVSRATVYRLFPGGRSTIMFAAVRAEVQRLLHELTFEGQSPDSLEACLVRSMHHAAVFLEGNTALAFMRDHERAVLEQVLSFDRMDALFVAAGVVMGPVLEPFLDPEVAAATGTWGARLVVSYLAEPSDSVDLCDVEQVRTVVRTFMIPGLSLSEHRSSTTS